MSPAEGERLAMAHQTLLEWIERSTCGMPGYAGNLYQIESTDFFGAINTISMSVPQYRLKYETTGDCR
jgi:hypothetical protein